jgi:DNA polymerase-3 subunit epsilon
MAWHRGLIASFDLETTGVDVETDRIVTASRWIIDPSKPAKTHMGWLVNPGIDIPEGAAAIHGITTEKAKADGQDASKAVREIAGDLLYWADQGAVTLAFNASYDLTLLHRECVRYGHTTEAAGLEKLRPVIDPHVIDKGLEKYRKGSRKLIDVAKHYGIELSEEDAHGSAADSLAAARIGYVIATRYEHIGRMPADELHDLQREWKALQAEGLQKYLRRKDKTAVVDPNWPLKPMAATVQEEIR